MDLDEFRSFISDSGVDVWTWMDMAISVASVDHVNELKNRRDGIVQKLYTPAFSNKKREINESSDRKQDVGFDFDTEEMGSGKSENNQEDGDNDDEQRKFLEIKVLLDDQGQSERCLIDLLQRLVEMDTTFKALKETDIGRHVTKLRKHSSNEVRSLVKILVRKWKDTVDEWVRLNTPVEEKAIQLKGDRNSPDEARHKSIQNLKYGQIESDEFNQNFHDEYPSKRRRTQVMDFHNIPKLKSSAVSGNGSTVPVKYW